MQLGMMGPRRMGAMANGARHFIKMEPLVGGGMGGSRRLDASASAWRANPELSKFAGPVSDSGAGRGTPPAARYELGGRLKKSAPKKGDG